MSRVRSPADRRRTAERCPGGSGSLPLAGAHSVREALRAGRRPLHRLTLLDGVDPALAAELSELATLRGIPIEMMNRADALLIAGIDRAQGALLTAGPLPTVGLDALVAVGIPGQRRLLALDGIEDPQNLGALARVADAAGVQGIVLTERRAAPLSPAVSRASAGAIEHVPVARIPNLIRALEWLQGRGFWLVGAEVDEGDDLYAVPDRILRGDLVLVLGAEGRGLRTGVRAVIDHRVRIPMAGQVASLNVATAGAVVLFELARRDRAESACD